MNRVRNPAQPSLPGLDATAPPFKPDAIRVPDRRPQRYTLFLAILPEPEDADRLARAATDLRSRHELHGTPLAPERMHITLHALPSFIDTLPQAVVDDAIAASAGVACPRLALVFDHVLSFDGSDAFVLRCDTASDAAVARLRRSLATALRRPGLRPVASSTPHMTMLYDSRRIARHAIEPIRWTAKRFALIVSHVGIGHHQRIAEWALTD